MCQVNSSIKVVWLKNNKIGDDGAIALAEAFKVRDRPGRLKQEPLLHRLQCCCLPNLQLGLICVPNTYSTNRKKDIQFENKNRSYGKIEKGSKMWVLLAAALTDLISIRHSSSNRHIFLLIFLIDQQNNPRSGSGC